MRITSLQNPRVKAAVALRHRRQRAAQGRVLIDGRREMAAALAAHARPLEIFFQPDTCGDAEAQTLLANLLAAGAVGFEVTAEVFGKLAYGERDEGLIAVFATRERSLEHLISVSHAPLLVVLEGIEKPGNLGAVLRTADAAGADGLIVADGGTDLENPNTIRASLGAVFTVPTCAAPGPHVLDWLRSRGIAMWAARVDGARSYLEADFRGPTALILGSESAGLSALWNQPDISPIHLPMLGQVDSLNVSVTAAVLLYEVVRQRKLEPA